MRLCFHLKTKSDQTRQSNEYLVSIPIIRIAENLIISIKNVFLCGMGQKHIKRLPFNLYFQHKVSNVVIVSNVMRMKDRYMDIHRSSELSLGY